MLVGALISGVGIVDVMVGLVVFPLIVNGVVLVGGRNARPIRFTGGAGHCINCALIVAAFILVPVSALLFYGTSMLIAASRGYGGCELFAFSNWVWGRDDQIGCPVFLLLDVAERRTTAHAGSR